ncbi:MAG: phosphate regulon sensor histidine kinase PhoR [Thiobacillaceae bacterium]
MQPYWWRTLAYLLGLLVLSLILWLAVAPLAGLLVLSVGLALQLSLHLYQLRRFEVWLGAPKQPLPASGGLWGDILHRVDDLLKSHRDARARSHAELAQMLDAARLLPDGVVILDAQHRIVWFNHAAQMQLGLKDGRDIGQFISYIIRNAAFNTWLTGTLGEGPYTMPTAGDGNRTLTLQRVPLPNDHKMLLCHDITELARVDAMRRDFVANVSHELRTPITVIVGFLEAFADMERPDPEQFKHHVQLMREQSDRIRRLVDDLLTLARLEADTENPREEVDVPTLAEGLLREAQSLSAGRHTVSLKLESGAKVRGSEKELHSAFGNLVSNAVRYTPSGGRITLCWRDHPAGGAEFSVTDTGEGIEAQHIPRLTERFYRVDRGRSRATGGTGLGLAIVKHVLQRHQAHLRVESSVGKGSTFTAVFPAERVIPAAKPRPQPPEQGAA